MNPFSKDTYARDEVFYFHNCGANKVFPYSEEGQNKIRKIVLDGEEMYVDEEVETLSECHKIFAKWSNVVDLELKTTTIREDVFLYLLDSLYLKRVSMIFDNVEEASNYDYNGATSYCLPQTVAKKLFNHNSVENLTFKSFCHRPSTHSFTLSTLPANALGDENRLRVLQIGVEFQTSMYAIVQISLPYHSEMELYVMIINFYFP